MKVTVRTYKIGGPKANSLEPSPMRAFGLEVCDECKEVEVANGYFFPEAYERKRLVKKPRCRYCIGETA